VVEPAEVAAAAVFLAADESRTLTGQIIAIHGGAFD
jgi:NAD(P)-dependent dehydrogenase (short-subunit alcohol dehydrogenase family)